MVPLLRGEAITVVLVALTQATECSLLGGRRIWERAQPLLLELLAKTVRGGGPAAACFS
jgi:hypothetical protein